jgi:predicted DNA-binding transcriptional regulator AlpA
MIPELEAIMRAARNVSPDELPRLLGDLEVVRAVAWSRLQSPVPPIQSAADELMDVTAAATKLGVSESYLYSNHAKLPFARKIGRSLRFSSRGIADYIAADHSRLTPRRHCAKVSARNSHHEAKATETRISPGDHAIAAGALGLSPASRN